MDVVDDHRVSLLGESQRKARPQTARDLIWPRLSSQRKREGGEVGTGYKRTVQGTVTEADDG
jgi:hypothetical protein